MTSAPSLDPRHNAAWRLLITANVKALRRIEERFSQAGLPSMDWYDVLLALKQAPGQRVRLSELAEQVLLSRSNLTHLLNRLEKAELLRRERCPSDRRGAYAVLTEQGLVLQQKMWIVYADAIGDYFGAHLNDEELNVMEQVLKRMIDATSQD